MEKKLLTWALSFLVLFLSGYPVAAQEGRGPKMVLEERIFDSGEVKQGKVIEHTFRVLNRGNETLRIVRVKPG